MVKEIQLTHDKVTIVDDEDYEHLSSHSGWCIQKTKYNYFYVIDKNHKYMHRIIMNAQKGQIIDHINHDTLDNRKENLRCCTHSENLRNRRLQCTNTSGYKGVRLIKTSGKWNSSIRVGNKKYHLGNFETCYKAAIVYDNAALYHYGRFANLNFPNRLIDINDCDELTWSRIKTTRDTHKNINNTSGYRGVIWSNKDKIWVSRIKINNRNKYLGGFKSKIEAALTYDESAVKYFGEHAKLNFPDYD